MLFKRRFLALQDVTRAKKYHKFLNTINETQTNLAVNGLPVLATFDALVQRYLTGLHIAAEYSLKVDFFAAPPNNFIA
jgi:hypothetical protein